MQDLASFAQRLAETTDRASAADVLAEHVEAFLPGAAIRLYGLGPGDRCRSCNAAPTCPTRDRCLHLEASGGAFHLPRSLVERIPRSDPDWSRALLPEASPKPAPPPAALAAPGEEEGSAVLVPLRAAGSTEGVLGIRVPAGLDADTLSRVQVVAGLGGAVFRMLESAERRQEQLSQLLLVDQLGRKVSSILDDDLLLRQAAEDLRRTFGFHNVMVFVRTAPDAEELVLAAQASRSGTPSRLLERVESGAGVVGRCLGTGKTVVVSDVGEDADFVRWFQDTQAEIAVPIRVGEHVVGVLNVESDRAGRFGEAERVILETVANQLAIALENARLFAMVKQREDRYRILVDANPGAVFYLNGSGQVVFANPAAAEVLGRDVTSLVVQGTTLVALATEGGRPGLEDAVREAIHGEGRAEVSFDILHASGGLRHVEASLRALDGEEGRPRGVVVLAWDRTRERELQDRLRHSEKLGAIGSLVSGVAHELNNPLAGILGYAQLLLAREPSTWARREIEVIEENARRCRDIVENLLTFARQANLSRRRVDLNKVIEGVLKLNAYQFEMDDITIEHDLDARIPVLDLDVNRWQQVFVNLVANARQAMVGAHSPTKILRLETRDGPDEVVVRVRDTGPGVPEEIRPRIFEPFFTTKDSGTGLGLGICFGIVSEHGGTIALESAAPGDTCFRLTIPRRLGREGTSGDPTPAARLGADVGGGRRVLVVDDEAHVRDVVERALEAHGFAVETVGDGQAALECIEREEYDVVITDVSMPGQTKGLALYDRIEDLYPDLADRVVFLTGHIHDEVLSAEIDSRGGRCVEKPFEILDLVRVVDEVATEAGRPARRAPSAPATE